MLVFGDELRGRESPFTRCRRPHLWFLFVVWQVLAWFLEQCDEHEVAGSAVFGSNDHSGVPVITAVITLNRYFT